MFVVRLLTSDDAVQLRAFAQSDPSFQLSEVSAFFSLEYLHEWLARPEGDLLVGAEVDGELVGFILCQVIRSSWSLWHNFFVARAHRRRGIGQALFDYVIGELRERDVTLCVAFARERDAVAFHVRNGASAGYSFTYVEWRTDQQPVG